MGAPAIPGVMKRGRPRSEQVERAILRAAGDLLTEHGLAAMTIEDVAARAGVAKTSIYRRWSTKGTLALDAFLADFLGSQPLPDTGNLENDLTAALRAWVRTVRGTPTGSPRLSQIPIWPLPGASGWSDLHVHSTARSSSTPLQEERYRTPLTSRSSWICSSGPPITGCCRATCP